MAKPHLFFISGLGADHRAFDRIKLDGYDQTHLHWIIPEKDDDIHSYAKKMAKPIMLAENPVVIGVSLGGMLASEMTTFIPHLRAIIISSIKSPKERSILLKVGRVFPAHRIIPVSFMKRSAFGWRWSKFRLPKHEVDHMMRMFMEQDNRFIRWALDNAPKWKGTGIHDRIHHIHGDKDFMFPHKRIEDPNIIKGGTHLMVYTRGKEVEKRIQEELNRLGGVG